MSLHPTASEYNLQMSLTKFFIDSLFTIEGIHIDFDKGFVVPGKSINEWCFINYASLTMSDLSELQIQIVIGTVKDVNGVNLVLLRDKVMKYLSDSEMPDGVRRITHYDASNDSAWSVIGGLMLFLMPESGRTIASNEAKFKIINCRVKWGTVI